MTIWEHKKNNGLDNNIEVINLTEDVYWFDIRKGRTSATDLFVSKYGGLAAGRAGSGSTNRRSALHCWVRNLIDYIKSSARSNIDNSGILLNSSSRYFAEVKKKTSHEMRSRVRSRNSIDRIRGRLIAEGWVELARKGYRKKAKRGMFERGLLSTYVPSQRFIDWFESTLVVAPITLTSQIKPISFENLSDAHLGDAYEPHLCEIRLSSSHDLRTTGIDAISKAITIDFEHPTVKATQSVLKAFNEFNLRQDWCYYERSASDLGELVNGGQVAKIFKHLLVYSRCFSRGEQPNHDYRFHGRFYCSLSLTTPKRDLILVGNEPTVEIDFNALHVRLAYSEKKIIPSFIDGYDLGEEANKKFGRTLIKSVFLTLINLNGTKRSKHHTVRKKSEAEIVNEIRLALCGSKRKLDSIPLLYKAKQKVRQQKLHLEEFGFKAEADALRDLVAPELIDNSLILDCLRAIQTKHPTIVDYFASDFGIRAQFLDSQIMLNSMKRAVDAQLPMLMYHDSIRVQESRYHEACNILLDSFELVTGMRLPAYAIKPNWSVLSEKRKSTPEIA